MKPIMLPSPQIKAPSTDWAISKAIDNGEGEIDSRYINGWDSAPFYEHLRQYGYRARKCYKYGDLTLTFVNGSARWHDDPGFGLVACWLVHSGNDLGYDAQLITRDGGWDMIQGDLCVFNADKGHAWLSNEVCVMVMATLAKLKGRA
jgi:hypothetical protein